MHLGKIQNVKDQPAPLHAVPKPAVGNFRPQKAAQSMSLSHNQFPNHLGGADIQAQFEPTFVKLDKQVSYQPTLCRPMPHFFRLARLAGVSPQHGISTPSFSRARSLPASSQTGVSYTLSGQMLSN